MRQNPSRQDMAGKPFGKTLTAGACMGARLMNNIGSAQDFTRPINRQQRAVDPVDEALPLTVGSYIRLYMSF
jgi:hypothetical protein